MADISEKRSIVEAAGKAFEVEAVGGCALTRGWRAALNEAVSGNSSALAFYWDDVVVRRMRGFRLDAYQVIWPQPDPLLLGQVDSRMRCAVSRETMRALARDGRIASEGDTSAALAWLAGAEPNRLVRLESVFRYTKSTDAAVYRPKAAPRPTRKAQSIAVIVNYRDHPDLTTRCIAGIASQETSAALELILINNQSAPDNRRRVHEAADRLRSVATVRHIDYDEPFNHSAQNNIGVSLAKSEVTILLNNDAELITPTCLQSSADWCLEDGVACAGPQIWGDRDRIVSNGVFIRAARGKQPALIRENEFPAFAGAIRQSAGISFCCAAVSKTTWAALGSLDEAVFPTQYNDADVFVRALQRGFRHIYVGTEICRHEPGQSETRSKQMTEERLKLFRQRYPDLGKFQRTDLDHLKMKSLPEFEGSFANRDMNFVRQWRKLRARIAPVIEAVRRQIA